MALITASRYNTLQSSVEGIMGTGSGDSGYGQSLASSQVSQGTVIEASHMANLYTDMINFMSDKKSSIFIFFHRSFLFVAMSHIH